MPSNSHLLFMADLFSVFKSCWTSLSIFSFLLFGYYLRRGDIKSRNLSERGMLSPLTLIQKSSPVLCPGNEFLMVRIDASSKHFSVDIAAHKFDFNTQQTEMKFNGERQIEFACTYSWCNFVCSKFSACKRLSLLVRFFAAARWMRAKHLAFHTIMH